MTHGQRRLGFILAALLVSAGIYGLWWDKAATAARQELERWIEERRAGGIDISYDGIETAGFPFAIELVVLHPQAQADWRWQGPERITARISPLAPSHVTIRAPGRHALQVNGRSFELDLARADVGVEASASGIGAVSLDLGKAVVTGVWDQPLGIETLTLAATRRADVPADDLSTPSQTLNLAADNILLPDGMHPPLGGHVARLVLKLALKGPPPASLSREQLDRWSQSGGVLETEYVYLDYPPLRVEGDGTLALDRDLLPLAPFGLKAVGAMEAVDGLAASGWIAPDAALPVKLALAVLAKTPPDPQTGAMALPLTLQGRGIYLGAAKIANLPPLPWDKD